MRTRDFSRAPALARAEALVVTSAVSDARAAAGFVWQRRFRESGRRGVIAFFATSDAARTFARTAGSTEQGGAQQDPASFIRVFEADPDGYSNGVWRVEDHEMRHIERFSPTNAEVKRGVEPPRVGGRAGPAALRGKRRTSAGLKSSHKAANRSLADAHAMFVGATRYRGPQSWLILSRTWYPMVAKMKRMPGFRWYAVYYDRPFTLGTLAFFENRDDLLAFARMPEHRMLMQWITRGTRNGTGGYIRLQLAEPAGEGDSA